MERLLVVDEAADFLRVNSQTIRRWVREGRLRALWSGRQLVFNEQELREFLQPAGTMPKT
jgi:excisionase family DNA binding protein